MFLEQVVVVILEAELRQREPPVEARYDAGPSKTRRPHGEKSLYSDDLHNELKTRMNSSEDLPSMSRGPSYRDPPASPRGPVGVTRNSPREEMGNSPRGSIGNPPSPRSPKRNLNITQYSSPMEVREWMESKGFSRRCIELLNGYNGADLFGLTKHELERLLGRDEGRSLDSYLLIQKNNAGFRTRGASELKAILERRKERAEVSDNSDGLGARPSFMPESPPDYSPPESEASTDSYGDAGKTLRNLLERQRKKINQGGSGYRGPYQ